eukprot:2189924-Pyramimonas_sp.AAC.2
MGTALRLAPAPGICSLASCDWSATWARRAGGGGLRALRAVRILRVLKLAGKWPPLQAARGRSSQLPSAGPRAL